MKILDNGNALTLWVSARDSSDWASKPGAAWPCSTLAGHRFVACFDTGGLCDLSVDGRDAVDVDGAELSAICADLLARKLAPDHPCYDVAVGQFVTA